MKLAICNETYGDWEWDRVLENVAQNGYDGLEIAPFTLSDHAAKITAQQRRDYRNSAQRAGIEIIGLHWLLLTPKGLYVTTPDDQLRRKTGEYFVDLVRLCSDLGGKVMVIGSPQQRNLLPGITKDRAMDYAVEVYGHALEEAERAGVTLAIEPLAPKETDFIRTAADGIELCEKINHPNFKLHLDVKAMSGSETDPLADVNKASAKELYHYHANDPNLLGPGMGEVDHRPLIAALKEINYDGWLSVEVFDYSPGPDVIAKKSIQYLRQCGA